jgi:hypothetical protein
MDEVVQYPAEPVPSARPGYLVPVSRWQGRPASSRSSWLSTRLRIITEKLEAMPEVLDPRYRRHGS